MKRHFFVNELVVLATNMISNATVVASAAATPVATATIITPLATVESPALEKNKCLLFNQISSLKRIRCWNTFKLWKIYSNISD